MVPHITDYSMMSSKPKLVDMSNQIYLYVDQGFLNHPEPPSSECTELYQPIVDTIWPWKMVRNSEPSKTLLNWTETARFSPKPCISVRFGLVRIRFGCHVGRGAESPRDSQFHRDRYGSGTILYHTSHRLVQVLVPV